MQLRTFGSLSSGNFLQLKKIRYKLCLTYWMFLILLFNFIWLTITFAYRSDSQSYYAPLSLADICHYIRPFCITNDIWHLDSGASVKFMHVMRALRMYLCISQMPLHLRPCRMTKKLFPVCLSFVVKILINF